MSLTLTYLINLYKFDKTSKFPEEQIKNNLNYVFYTAFEGMQPIAHLFLSRHAPRRACNRMRQTARPAHKK